MSTPTPGSDGDQTRLDIARRVYKALVAQDPDRLIMLCDAGGCVLARNERRPKEDAGRESLIAASDGTVDPGRCSAVRGSW
jgi:hypothetical protein